MTDSDGLYGRWQALQLLSPIFELINRAAPRAGFEHSRYDLGQMCLRTIDFVVLQQASLAGSVSPERVIDHLRNIAQRMVPDDLDRPWQRVATTTFNSLWNEGRKHEVTWSELADANEEWAERRTFRFTLLEMVDGEEGPAVKASSEAILLYLRALNTDLADQATALKLLVEIQMNAGEFDKALHTAREATRTAKALAATLRHDLDDTRRDVRSVDWSEAMPAFLSDTARQITAQIERDRHLWQLAGRAGDSDDVAEVCRQIVAEVQRSEEVWTMLEQRVVGAIPTFLEAQRLQRFAARSMVPTLDLGADMLAPFLGVDEPTALGWGGLLAEGVLAPRAPVQYGVDELVKALLDFREAAERPDPVAEDDELGEADDVSIPEDVAAAASDLFRRASGVPVRLSDLLAEARAHSDEVADAERLCDVVWGAALWAFVSEANGADEAPPNPVLAEVLGPLAAADDGTVIDSGRYRCADLMVGTPAGLDMVELYGIEASDTPDAVGSADGGVVLGGSD